MWDALTDVQCAEGSRVILQCSEQIRMVCSAQHVTFNKRRPLSECSPKGEQEGPSTRPAKEQMWERGVLNLDTEYACLQTFQANKWKRNSIILNFKSYKKNQFSAADLFFFWCFETGSYCVAQANLELTALPHQSPSWDYRHVSSHLTLEKSLLAQIAASVRTVWATENNPVSNKQ